MAKPDLLYERFRAVLMDELRRHDLEAWMRTHRAEVETLLAGGEMDWTQAAAHFAAAGLRVGEQRPNARSAEATWRRVTDKSAPSKRRRPTKG
jgi:hypothetical protein